MLCPDCGTQNIATVLPCQGCGSQLRGEAQASPAPDGSTDRLGSASAPTVSTPSDPVIGRVIANRYRIEAQIGGSGTVYRATRLLIGDSIAIKILYPLQNADPMIVERFRRAAQTSTRLKHPNAVSVYDFGTTPDGFQYLVMELVEGQSLRQIIKQQGLLQPAIVAEIITQVCAALAEAHRQGLTHRALTPDNIMVMQQADGLRIKVLNFGMTKLKEQATSALTVTNPALGAARYMSPEQCLGEELDDRSNIYSLGIVMYELLTGAVPFDASVPTAVVIQQVNQLPPSLREKNPALSLELEVVVRRALEKRRDARPQSADALAQELRAVVNAALRSPSGQQKDTSPSGATGGSTRLASVPTVLLKVPSTGDIVASTRKKRSVLLICAALVLLLVGEVIWLLKIRAGRAEANTNITSSAPEENDPNKLPVTFVKRFAGTIKNGIKIEMTLQRNAGSLSGTYYYQPTDQRSLLTDSNPDKQIWVGKNNELILVDIQITGTIDEQQRCVLNEFDKDGKRSGGFKGEFISPSEMNVTWSRGDGKEIMSFSLKEQSGDMAASSYHIIAKQFKRTEKNTSIEITYPQIEGLANKSIQESFNWRMQRPINETLKSVDESNSQSTDDSHIDETSSFTIKYRSSRLISILFPYSSDWGGAHPNYGTSSFNYDLQSGRELKLKDLFRSNAPYLGFIASLCANDVNRQKRANGVGEPVSESDILEIFKNSETFGLTEQGLIMVFDPYQLGSFAEGAYWVLIPYSALRGIVDSNGVLASLV